MKKLKISKNFGVWFYERITPSSENGLDAPLYELQKDDKTDGGTFGSFNDMLYYIKFGKNIG